MVPIAIAFSDFHINAWKKFSFRGSRTQLLWRIMSEISNAAIKHKVPILFPGDLFHNPKYLENAILQEFVFNYSELIEDRGIQFYAISGNHDMSEKNSKASQSSSYIRTFSQLFKTFHNMDFNMVGPYPMGFTLSGVPYINGNKGFNKAVKDHIKNLDSEAYNILMIHTDLPQATDTFGHEIKEAEGIKTKYFKHFSLVIDGHIHKPQKISKNTYILGSPYQQTRSEKGLELGYWEIYRDAKPKLIPISTPKFIDIPEGEPIPDDGNYYTVIPKPKADIKIRKGFNNKTDKVKIAKRYLKHTKEKDKQKKKALIKILNSTE